jgi:ACS family tartrate transporter-like MFS transporter
MNSAIGLTAEMFGFGAGLFFFGYAIFEIPSNLVLSRLGAPLWLGRIMVTWGLVAIAFAAVGGPNSFYVLRFLLGAAEAGFSPGIILYFAQWFPRAHRGTPMAIWMMGPALAAIIGGPLAAALMSLDWFSLPGWRWLFLIEGLPAIALGLALPFVLPKDVRSVTWLSESERAWVTGELEKEAAEKTDASQHQFLSALASPTLWIYTFTFFCISISFYSLYFWLPQVLKSGFADLTTTEIGFMSSLPYCITLVTSTVIARHSDRTGDRRWHLFVLGIGAGVGLVVAGQTGNSPLISYAALTVAICCTWAYLTIFNVVPTVILAGTAAAGGFAFINAIGNLGGFFGPYMIGALKDLTGSFSSGISILSIFVVLMAFIPIALPRLFRNVRREERENAARGELPSPAEAAGVTPWKS